MKFSDYLRDRFSKAGQARRAHRSEFTETAQRLRGVVLQHQGGQYRVFHVSSGKLIHSHEAKVEVVRRAERDGFLFGFLEGA